MAPSTHLLIVDDEVAYADALAHFLRHEGYSVGTAYTIADARAAIRARTPQLIVLDVRLPDGSGLDLLAELRAPRSSSSRGSAMFRSRSMRCSAARPTS